MSYSFAIVDGDLALQGSQLGLVFGVDKLRQDMMCWMMERHGGDRFHTNYGSIFQDFIGGLANETTKSEIHSEVFRILQNYQSQQLRRWQENPQAFSASELLVSVEDIKINITYDTLTISMRMRNGSKDHTTIQVVKTT